MLHQPTAGHVNTDGTGLGSDWHALMQRRIAIFTIMGALLFNLLLCFVNTRVLPVRDSYVMGMEMLLIGLAFLALVGRRLDIYLILFLYLSYMMMLFALRHEMDLKAVRDMLVPVAFYLLGTRVRDLRLADTLVLASAVIVIVIGLFEYLLTEVYLDNFNVLGYFLARGSLLPEETFGATRGLFISGIRPEPRTLLSFLGQHRVSSVFLEPVSAGNFGVIAFAWALFRADMRGRWATMALALAAIVLADARFGFYTCVLLALLMPVYRFIPRPIWLVAPFLMLAVIAAYGLSTGTEGGPNDIGGRLRVTASILTQLDLPIVLGIATTDQFTADSGLAYTLTKFGLFGFVALWALFVYAPMRSPRAWTFHSMVIIYLLLLMLISNSFYSIKTAALLWFVLGTAHRIDWFAGDAPPDGAATRDSAAHR